MAIDVYNSPANCMQAAQMLPAYSRLVLPGLLVPDIPLEETGEIREAASNAGLELVLLTTPTTPRERMQAIAKASQGFVYLVSVTGASSTNLLCICSCVTTITPSVPHRPTCCTSLKGFTSQGFLWYSCGCGKAVVLHSAYAAWCALIWRILLMCSAHVAGVRILCWCLSWS